MPAIQIGGNAPPNPGAGAQPAPNPGVGLILQKYRHEVLVRADWDDNTAWETAPYLTAIAANDTVYPTHATATFRYEYGDIRREDAAAFAAFLPLQGRDLYVCINILPEIGFHYPVWVGIIPSEELRVFASGIAGGVVAPSGDQTLRAYGLSYLLDRRTPMLSFVEDDTQSTLTAIRLRRFPAFNEKQKHGQRFSGNRSADKITFDDGGGAVAKAYGFGDENAASGNPVEWTHGDVLEYLLWMSGLRDGQESNVAMTDEPQFVIGGPPDVITYLDSLVSTIRQDGASAWAMIGKIIDRKRGLLMRVVWDTRIPDNLPSGNVALEIDTLIPVPVVVGDVTLPANVTGRDLRIDTGLDISDASITIDEVKQYEFIVVQGARTVSCFTMTGGTRDGEFLPAFEDGWSDASETAYIAADEAGRKAAELSRVFRVYRLPSAFDWIMPLPAPLPDPLPQHVYLNPSYDIDANFSGGASFWNANRSFLRELPIVDPGDDAASTDDARFLRTLTIVGKQIDAAPAALTWFPAHDVPVASVAGASNARVANVPNELGVDVRFSPPDHLAADVSASFPEAPFNKAEMMITVAVVTDMAPRVTIRLGGFAGRGRQLRISVPDAEVWMVANDTIIGTHPSGVPRYHNNAEGSLVRDDRERLRGVAALARAWYGEPRALLRAVMPGLLDAWRPGTFVKAIGTFLGWQVVSSPITERSWDFEAGTTMIRTGSMELDVRAVR